MKICFLTVLYNTPESEVKRLQKQVLDRDMDFFDVDNTTSKKGYAEGINTLLKQYLHTYDIFFIGNPDIDISQVSKKTFLEAAHVFDIWGYAMKQDTHTYYGGVIDKWRMSGGLNQDKPVKRFTDCDFVSGSLMAVKQEVFYKSGLLEESFGMYYEDVEFCFRARKKGFKVGIDRSNVYTHFEESKTNSKKQKYLAKNRMKFLWRYSNLQQKLYEIVRLPKTLIEEKTNLL